MPLNRPHHPPRQSPAFTLVELLVVIAIISVLAGMLMPALSRAIDSARKSNCQSNLRQLGVAFQAYSDDHSGFLPGPTWTKPDLTDPAVTLLKPYLDNKSVTSLWRCPAMKFPTNCNFTAYFQHAFVLGYYGSGISPACDPMRLQDVIRKYTAENQWLIEDIDLWSYPNYPDIITWKPIHDHGRNLLFADTHVKWLLSTPGVTP